MLAFAGQQTRYGAYYKPDLYFHSTANAFTILKFYADYASLSDKYIIILTDEAEFIGGILSFHNEESIKP